MYKYLRFGDVLLKTLNFMFFMKVSLKLNLTSNSVNINNFPHPECLFASQFVYILLSLPLQKIYHIFIHAQ